jgi:hypothetical protein
MIAKMCFKIIELGYLPKSCVLPKMEKGTRSRGHSIEKWKTNDCRKINFTQRLAGPHIAKVRIRLATSYSRE